MVLKIDLRTELKSASRTLLMIIAATQVMKETELKRASRGFPER